MCVILGLAVLVLGETGLQIVLRQTYTQENAGYICTPKHKTMTKQAMLSSCSS